LNKRKKQYNNPSFLDRFSPERYKNRPKKPTYHLKELIDPKNNRIFRQMDISKLSSIK
jgi:hypothetical protein